MSCPPGGLAGKRRGRGFAPPWPVPLPSLGGLQCGRHWRRSGHGGQGPRILVRFVVACRPWAWSVRRSCALVRVRPPVATPAGAGGGGRGDARRAGPATSPPGRRGPFWGRGDVPLGSGGLEGRRPRGPQVGGGIGGERGGGGGALLFPTSLSWGGGPWPPSLSPWAPPLGINVQPGSPGSHGRWVRPGRLPVGHCGGGGGGLFVAVCPPAFPGRASRRAASSVHSWVPPIRCGLGRQRRAAGWQRAMRE